MAKNTKDRIAYIESRMKILEDELDCNEEEHRMMQDEYNKLYWELINLTGEIDLSDLDK